MRGDGEVVCIERVSYPIFPILSYFSSFFPVSTKDLKEILVTLVDKRRGGTTD